MGRAPGACLICGKPLLYFETEREMTCAGCGKTFLSRASCEDGHYICDDCHARRGAEAIVAHCRTTTEKDPIAIAQALMNLPEIHMHGNEHHILVGAALMAAYRNAGGAVDLDAGLGEMCARGSQYPGGACGFWGCCGAAVSAGMFFSIVTGATPLSGKSWGLDNRLTGAALTRIGELGGPRCCKRNTYTAILTAAAFVQEHLGVELALPPSATCVHSAENQQCIRKKCPYYPGAEG